MKSAILFVQISRKCKLIHNDKKQIRGCLGMQGREKQETGITRGHRETLG